MSVSVVTLHETIFRKRYVTDDTLLAPGLQYLVLDVALAVFGT